MVLNNEKQTQMSKRDLMRISIVAIAAFAMSSCGQMKELQANMDQLKMQVQDLTTDDDQDGVSNKFDAEANTPANATVDVKGVAMDTDHDGVADHIDADPFSANGAKLDAEGRERDSDGDGVPDSHDMDNSTPAGKMVNFQGKEIEAPASAAIAASFPVYFGFNSASVSGSEQRAIAAMASAMRSNSEMKVTLVGYADKQGLESYNLKLSERRAKAVMDALVNSYGIDAARISTMGKGASEMAASDRNDMNRRVEFVRSN